jgi:phosphohistidine phosphatase
VTTERATTPASATTLGIMRHGPAEDFSATGRDFDRVLTPKGKDRVRDVARALVGAGEAPSVILTSPLVRARETAEEVQRVLGNVPIEIAQEMSPGRDALGLVTTLFHEGRRGVLLVGHEPDLSDLVSCLVGFAPRQGMLKAMVVGVDLSPDASEGRGFASSARFVLDPKTLVFER